MNRLKKILFILFILLTMVFLLRGWLYRHVMSYRSIGTRTNYSVHDSGLIRLIESSSAQTINPDARQLTRIALRITSASLNYSARHNDQDPNQLFRSKYAHCVGYAAFCAALCNYLFKKFKPGEPWHAQPVIGKLYFLGINVHQYFNTPMFIDHDFVIIENRSTGEVFAVDPTLNDYLAIERISFKK